MGLASSQARLLQLTTRMHQIEYKAAKLEAEKLQMANESRQVYEDYQNALEDTKVQYKILNTDGSATYTDIKSYQDFIKAGYAIDFRGTVYDGEAGYRDAFNNSITFTKMTEEEVKKQFGDTETGEYYKYTAGTDSGNVSAAEYANLPTDGNKAEIATKDGGSITVKSVTNDYAQLCADAFKADVNNPPKDVEEVITNLISSGHVTIVQQRKDNTFAKEDDQDFSNYETSIATNTGLQEVSDEKHLKKAEAKYEADMKRIDMKDRTFDTELAAVESERNALKQEMETLKTVSKDNVERTFKLFG